MIRLLFALLTPLAPVAAQPNIVLILADDLGASDLSHTGSDYHRTPNLAAMARYGLTARQAYSCGPNCVPTRAALASGLYAPRTGMYTVGESNRGKDQFRKLMAPVNNTILSRHHVTIAEVLRSVGYRTAHFGKWHLGDPGSSTHGPAARGFDVTGGLYLAEGENRTNELTGLAMDYLAAPTPSPFFCVVSYFSPHTPIEAPAEDRAAVAEWPVGQRHRNPTYCAMIKNLDDCVGRLLSRLATTLDPRGDGPLIYNTVVVFVGDNGGLLPITDNSPFRGGKGMLYEGGLRVPLFVLWPGVLGAGSTLDEPVVSIDLLPTLAKIGGARLASGFDGVDFLSPALARRSAVFWHFPCYLEDNVDAGTWRTTPASAIRRGPWKLIYFYESSEARLYNLASDPSESANATKANFGVALGLCAELRAWLVDTDAAMPLDKDTLQPVPYPHMGGPEAK